MPSAVDKPKPPSLVGEPTKPNEEIRQRTISVERSSENKASGEAELKSSLTKPFEFSGKGGASHAATTKESVSHSEESKHLKVRAMGNLKWEVTQPPWEEQVLNLTYLDNEVICKIETQDRANHKSIQLKAIVKQKDIVLEASRKGLPVFRNHTQKKLMNIVVAKALSSEASYNGTVTFSESVFEIED